jgi:hypothetical protein
MPHLTTNKGKGNLGALIRLAMNPLLWAQLMVYGFVKVTARIRAKRQWRSQSAYAWERDDSSRKPQPQAARQ